MLIDYKIYKSKTWILLTFPTLHEGIERNHEV